MKTISLTINDKTIKTESGTTLLEAAKQAAIEIPTLCYLKEINENGVCRMCVVEVEGSNTLMASCQTQVQEGMVVQTNSQVVRDSRRTTLELLLSNHPFLCETCVSNNNCGIQKTAKDLDISMYYSVYRNSSLPFVGEKIESKPEQIADCLTYDAAKCILCRRCTSVCDKVQSVKALDLIGEGFETRITLRSERACVDCGQCITHCPTGALKELDGTTEVMAALQDPDKHVAVILDTRILGGLNELLKTKDRNLTTGQFISQLKRMGVEAVYDAAEFERESASGIAAEFRSKTKNELPLISSVCPSLVVYISERYPQLKVNLSAAATPQQIFAVKAKGCLAADHGVKPDDIYCVSISSCLAQKAEVQKGDGNHRLNAALTGREFYSMMDQAGVLPYVLKDACFDTIGLGSDADAFGADGSCVAAVVGNAAQTKSVAVSGLGNVEQALDAISADNPGYQFVELLACPGGCENGGGCIGIVTDHGESRMSVIGNAF